MTHRINMRMSGTAEDLEAFLYLMHKLEEQGIVEVLEESTPYKNRGQSKINRVYLNLNFLLEPLEVKS